MNPMQQNNIPQPQQQQNTRLEHEKQERTEDRDITIREDQTVINNTIQVETVLTPEQTVERYNSVAHQLQQLGESYDAYTNKIRETLEGGEHEGVVALHVMMESEPQESRDQLPDDVVNSLTGEDLSAFQNLQEMASQRDQIEKTIENGLADLYDLYQVAEKMATEHGMELGKTPDELEEEIGF